MDKEGVSVSAEKDFQPDVFEFLKELQDDPCKNCGSEYCLACCYEFCSACCPYCGDGNRAGKYPPFPTLSPDELKIFGEDSGARFVNTAFFFVLVITLFSNEVTGSPQQPYTAPDTPPHHSTFSIPRS
jgi:hypothetical protein